MERVWIRKGKPAKVIEKDNVHYFYFPIELGLGKIRVFRIPIPLPVKWPDYEPVKVVRLRGRAQVVSRFHYRILTYFNNPELNSSKAIVDFSFGSHSPYVHSKRGSTLGTKIAIDRLGAIEAQYARFLVLLYEGIVSGKLKLKPDHLDDYEVEKGDVPQETIFKERNCHSVVWVGTFPERRDTPKDVWNVLH